MKSRTKCVDGSSRIYEINVAVNLCDAIRSGLRDRSSAWQQHMNHAARILNAKEHVSMASFITDRDNSRSSPVDDPYLFVVSDNLSTGQHYIDTVRLCEQTSTSGMGVIHEISHGKPCWHVSESKTENGFLRFLTPREEDYVLPGISVNRI
ncbi:MAG: hypothetical protein EP297_05300 [Gammaproteobacteria bacterium]|nr:MAG: hypothetical protein EP297_05300 [Gammaproteobacteria bacterium]